MRQLKIPKSFTARSSTSLEKYFVDIAKEELLTTEDEVRLAKLIKKGDSRALDKLVNANLRFVVSVAKQYQHRGLTLQDLISEGNIGLIVAAKRFDETRGFKFISYAVWWIRQSILNALNNQASMIRVPLNKINDLNKIKTASALFEQQNEREPTPEELAAEIDYSPDEISKIIRAPSKITSMDAPIGENGDNSSLSDVMFNPDAPGTDAPIINESMKADIERALSKLSLKESSILRMFYGIDSEHAISLGEIGSKYNLSKERIRQIKDRAIRRLRKTEKMNLKDTLEAA